MATRCSKLIGTAAAILAIAAAVAPRPASALPKRFWGVVPQATVELGQQRRLHRGGVDSIRVPFFWAAVQPAPGAPLDWSAVDARVERAARARLELLPFLYGAPPWAVPSRNVPGTGGKSEAPVHLPVRGRAGRGWAIFVRGAVERYGPHGTFWPEHPTVPRRPIHVWQVWNEPNFKYFVTHPRPGEYGRLVRRTAHAVRGADRHAKIVLAGLFARPIEATWRRRPPLAYFATDFLERMYRSNRGIASQFDGVALHPYTSTYRFLPPEIREVRDVMRRHGDGRKGLWLTEIGWSSERPSRRDSFAKGVRGQARELRRAFSLLRRNQRRWRLRRVYWFSVDDARGSCNFCGGAGLFRGRFRPKPAWHAYVRFAGGRAR